MSIGVTSNMVCEAIHAASGLKVRSNGEVFQPTRKVWTKGHVDGSCKYYRISYNGKRYCIHRLVAETFIPNPEGKTTVDHIDMNRLNNDVSNLRWATYSEQNRNRSVHYASVAKYGVCCADDRAEYIHAYHAVKQGKSPQDTPRKPRLNLTPEERKQRKKEQKHRWYLKHRERNLEYAHKYYMLKQQASKEAA